MRLVSYKSVISRLGAWVGKTTLLQPGDFLREMAPSLDRGQAARKSKIASKLFAERNSVGANAKSYSALPLDEALAPVGSGTRVRAPSTLVSRETYSDMFEERKHTCEGRDTPLA